MKKTIKRVGSSKGIIFNKEDCGIYDIDLGDVVDLGDIIVHKRKKSLGDDKNEWSKRYSWKMVS